MSSPERPIPVIADNAGRLTVVHGLKACAMEGGHFFTLDARDLVPIPPSSRFFRLPNRAPIGLDPATGAYLPVADDAAAISALAVFLPPGYTITHTAAFIAPRTVRPLPLYAYAPVVFHRGRLMTAAVRTDTDTRHACDPGEDPAIARGIASVKKLFPRNRLFRHLAGCATSTRCPNARNLFIHEAEGPLPTTNACNASCRGCISYQPCGAVSASQERIAFSPTAEEVSEVALYHLEHTREPVVSFGQGCDGEPLMSWRTIERAIRLIRSRTGKGVINMNTNASKPDGLLRLIDAGLQSIRVSMNSTRPLYYTRYYRPRGYGFADVLASLKLSRSRGIHISLNYLSMPGFTDTRNEREALLKLVSRYRIDAIQWRNLNIDPHAYFRAIGFSCPRAEIIGMRQLLRQVSKAHPGLRMGYFNPRRISKRTRP